MTAAKGGTGQDSSASSGVPEVSAGTWSFGASIGDLAASTSAALRGVLSDETGTGAAVFADGNIGTATGTVPMAGDVTGTTGASVVGDNTHGHSNTWTYDKPGKALDPCGAETTAPASQDTRNGRPVIAFEDGTNATKPCACFEFRMSPYYSGGGLTITYTSGATATTGTTDVEASFERLNSGGQDWDLDGFASAVAANFTPNTTSGTFEDETIAFTDGAQIDSLAAGELGRIMTCRDSDDATNDTMTGDWQIGHVAIMETTPQ